MKKSKKIFIFTSKQFKIRENLEKDAKVWYKWFNDPKITKFFVNDSVPNTLESQKKYRLQHIEGKTRVLFSVVSGRNEKLMGVCSINFTKPTNSRRCEISLVIGEPDLCLGHTYIEINKWLINSAFDNFGMNSILSSFFSNNEVVKKTVEFLGFKKVGILRDRFFKFGKFQNAYQYDLIKSDWVKLNK